MAIKFKDGSTLAQSNAKAEAAKAKTIAAKAKVKAAAQKVKEENWEKRFAILQRRNGQDVNAEQDVNIGSWINAQRFSYNAGKLSAERIARLEAIGFKWERGDANWEGRFDILERLYHDGNDVNVEFGTVIDGIRIGDWVHNQRQLYKAKQLSVRRRGRLEAIGFKWEI
jgi:hypothetical protein